MGSSIRELFDKLNTRVNYLVLRNWNDIFNESVYGKGHEDIDILCADKQEFINLTGAKKIHRNKHRDNYIISYGSLKIRFDIRWVGDNYYPANWESSMLRNRVMSENGVFVMSKEDYCFSLAYHALLQKPFLSEEYFGKINASFKELTKGVDNLDESTMLLLLNQFLIKNGYKYVFAQDPAVYVNIKNVNSIVHKFELRYQLRRLFYRISTKLGMEK